MTSLVLLVVLSLAVPGAVVGAGDDCPPPGDGGNDEVYTPPEEEGGEEQPTRPEEGGSDEGDGGALGSLAEMSSSQLTFGILAIVGVIVAAVYFYIVTRMDEDILE